MEMTVNQLSLPLISPWEVVVDCAVDYIVKKQVLDADYVIFLDFDEYFYPDRNDTEASLARLFKSKKENSLSYSGWLGYFSYDFLAAHMGVNCQAERDIAMPDGCFVRPQTIIYFKQKETFIESLVPGRCEELGKLASRPESAREIYPKPA